MKGHNYPISMGITIRIRAGQQALASGAFIGVKKNAGKVNIRHVLPYPAGQNRFRTSRGKNEQQLLFLGPLTL